MGSTLNASPYRYGQHGLHVGNMIAFDTTSNYAYASPATGPQNNIGSNQIQGYSVNPATGDLTPITGATATLSNSPQSIAVVSRQ